MNVAKAHSCSDGSDDQQKGQEVMVYKEIPFFETSMIEKDCNLIRTRGGLSGISQSTWQRIPCSTMYPGGQLVVSLKILK